jgi:hypothetical protein
MIPHFWHPRSEKSVLHTTFVVPLPAVDEKMTDEI